VSQLLILTQSAYYFCIIVFAYMMSVHVFTEDDDDDVRTISWYSNYLGDDFYHVMTITTHVLH